MPRLRRDPLDLLLTCGLSLDQPFTTEMAAQTGLERRHLGALVRDGLIVRPFRGLYRAASLPDTLESRVAGLRLVVPASCVVTDRTAAWLHGAAMALAPNDHLAPPQVSVFHTPGNRLRNGLSVSGERRLAARDIEQISGLRVTTPLRTACDLGRLLHRDSALAALDALLRLGRFASAELVDEVERFKGFRGVRQLRALAPLSDPGSESFGESALRLRWLDSGIGARPETQVVVHSRSRTAILDLGDRSLRFAAEYDGAAFHGPDQAEADRRRRLWLAELGWTVVVFRRDDVFGRHQDAIERIRRGLRQAKLRAPAGSAT